MPYKPISLPYGLSTPTETLIREQVDPLLHDVRDMFLLPFGHDPNGEGGCNFPIATTLVGVLAGLTSVSASTRGNSRKLFIRLIERHYPDEQNLKDHGALDRRKLAESLWNIYRCPLEHALGRIDGITRTNLDQLFGRGMITDVRVDKGRLSARDIGNVERAAEKGARLSTWTKPTLWVDGTELRLTAIILYWGVRCTVVDWAMEELKAQVPALPTSKILVPASLVPGVTEPAPTKVDSGSTG